MFEYPVRKRIQNRIIKRRSLPLLFNKCNYVYIRKTEIGNILRGLFYNSLRPILVYNNIPFSDAEIETFIKSVENK